MNTEEMIEKIVEVEQRSKSNTKRIDSLEKNTEALTDLVIVVKEMNVKQDYTIKKVDKIDSRVSKIEEQPAKRWNRIVEKALTVIVGAILGFVISKLGL